MMEFVIVTGLSGSGKSSAANVLEDIGYFCIDNMPPQLIPKFAELCRNNEAIQKVAIVTDIRGGTMFLELSDRLNEIKSVEFNVKLLYVDAATEIVKKRYKETRRRHPLYDIANGDVEKAINAENEILQPLKDAADFYIDTSYITTAKLNETLLNLFMENPDEKMVISCLSFGFKYGVPNDADLVFDLRCLPNPFYVPELKYKNGLDADVRDYVMAEEDSKIFEQKLRDLLIFLVPEYIKEGKSQLIIAFGCTGGKHRSVTFAERFCEYLSKNEYRATALHRDISK